MSFYNIASDELALLNNMRVPYVKNNDILSYEVLEDGRIIVEGIAGDTGRDIDGDIASKGFLAKLASDLPGRPVFYNHNYKAPPIGRVLDAKIIDNGDRLWAKCELYPYDPAIREGVLNESLRWFSIGAVGTRVRQGVIGGRPTKIFEDGYGQELTVTGAPINPTAAFRIAKSFDGNLAGYTDIDSLAYAELFIKSVQEEFGFNPMEVKEEFNNLVMSQTEDFMKSQGSQGSQGMIRPDLYTGQGRTSGGTDSLNPAAAVSRPQLNNIMYGQLPAQTLDMLIRKAMEVSSDMNEFSNNYAFLYEQAVEIKKSLESGSYRTPFIANYMRGYTGGTERLNGAPHPKDDGGFPDAGPGVFAREVTESLRGAVYAGATAPNYGTHPEDAKYLTDHIDKKTFAERGYDDETVAQYVRQAGPETLGPVGQGKNPGVNPLDQEFLRQGLTQLPPATKSKGYVHSGKTNVRKASDLLEDEYFLSRIHFSPYTFRKGIGDQESHMEYIHRLLHERMQDGIDPDGHYIKAIDGEMVDAINRHDFQNPLIEDEAIFEHILDDPRHAKIFMRALEDDPRSFYYPIAQRRKGNVVEEEDYEKAGMPPWLKDKDDEKGGDKDEKSEKKSDKDEKKDKDEKSDKDEKKDKFGKNADKFKNFKKKSDDEDEDEDVEKSFDPDFDEEGIQKAYEPYSNSEVEQFVNEAIAEKIQTGRAETYAKGFNNDPVRTPYNDFPEEETDLFNDAVMGLLFPGQ